MPERPSESAAKRGGSPKAGKRTRAASFEALDWYDAPHYYDLIFDTDTVREADFLAALVQRYAQVGVRGGRLDVLEPACGSGRLVVELAARGHRVVGFDASVPMLDYARERLRTRKLRAAVFEARMESFDVPEKLAPARDFILAHCLVSTFKYLLSERDARSHLERVAASLAPGGIYALGFHLSDYHETKGSRERWVVRAGKTEVVCTIEGWAPVRRTRREKVRSRLVVRAPDSERRLETVWDFRTYDADQVRRLLRSVPALELIAVHDFDYDIGKVGELGEPRLDSLLVLRRRGP